MGDYKIAIKCFVLIALLIASIGFASAAYDVSYDLSASVSAVVNGSKITTLTADPGKHIIYFGTDDAKFGYYNETSNTSRDLTAGIAGWAAGQSYSMTLNPTTHRLYFAWGQGPVAFGYYDLATNTTTQLPETWFFYTTLAYDSLRNRLWYVSNDNDFGYFTVGNLSKYSLGASGGWTSATCLLNSNSMLFMGFIAGTQDPLLYSIGNATTKDLIGTLPFNIWSCDKDDSNDRLWFGCGETNLETGFYNYIDGSAQTVFTCADGPVVVATEYMANSDTVAFLESGGELGGRIYDPATNTIEWIQDTDPAGWMDAYQMAGGDYMTNSKRLYIGFTGGGFGYYDNNIQHPDRYQVVGSNIVNNSQVNLSGVASANLRGYYQSNNLSSSWLALYANGTEINRQYAANNTWVVFNTENLTRGFWLLWVNNSKNTTKVYRFTVVNITSTATPTYDDQAASGLYPGLAGFLFLDCLLIFAGMFLVSNLKTNWDLITVKKSGEQNVTTLRTDMALKFMGIFLLLVMGLVVSGYTYFASVHIHRSLGDLAFVFFILNIFAIILSIVIAVLKMFTIPFGEVRDIVDNLVKEGNHRR